MASYCGKCSLVWDGSKPFISCETCAATFDIDCVKITKTMFNTFSSSKNWSWRCDTCKYSSYRVMSNNLKELTNVVDLLRKEIDIIKKQISPKTDSNISIDSPVSPPNTSLRHPSSATLQTEPLLAATQNHQSSASIQSQHTSIESTNQLESLRQTRSDKTKALSNLKSYNSSKPSQTIVNDNSRVELNDVVQLEAASFKDKKWFYLSNLKPGTTENMVKSFICTKMNVDPSKLYVRNLLKRNHDPGLITFTSFKVGFHESLDISTKSSIWPENVSFGPFIPKNEFVRRHR